MDLRFRAAVEQARKSHALYFSGLISESRITESLCQSGATFHGWIYSGAVTVWVFLSQCLSVDHSCRDAVARLLAWRVKNGMKPCSADTGAYCVAREQLAAREQCQSSRRALRHHVMLSQRRPFRRQTIHIG